MKLKSWLVTAGILVSAFAHAREDSDIVRLVPLKKGIRCEISRDKTSVNYYYQSGKKSQERTLDLPLPLVGEEILAVACGMDVTVVATNKQILFLTGAESLFYEVTKGAPLGFIAITSVDLEKDLEPVAAAFSSDGSTAAYLCRRGLLQEYIFTKENGVWTVTVDLKERGFEWREEGVESKIFVRNPGEYFIIQITTSNEKVTTDAILVVIKRTTGSGKVQVFTKGYTLEANRSVRVEPTNRGYKIITEDGTGEVIF